ncbi:class I SAM-dependent methyltransferase [Candidatus Parcubacteria bacterium]|nr:MAG: class I SAM-dependent methyltransferase [Candidatus Parcubacteria bacterium]
MFFADSNRQHELYSEIIETKRKTSFFSCGYYERFDPFLLKNKPFIKPIYEDFFASLFTTKTGVLLDLGCGTCFYWPVLAGFCDMLYGIDYSQAMLNEAAKILRNLPSKAFLSVGSSDLLPYGKATFDSVIAFDVLHHLPSCKGAMREIYRVLKPGGTFFSIEPNMANPMMLLAHTCPMEERLAVARNWPRKMRKESLEYFDNAELSFYNIVISANSEKTISVIRKINSALNAIPLLKKLSFRFLLKCKKM